jgi:CheY-like chemotaxis protein
MKIFVVEDAPVESKLAVTVLHAAGHDVERADTAEEALPAIRENQPDVVLLDLALPGMDGLALARLLRSDAVTRGIPIVAVTSYSDDFPRAEAMSAGCNAYIRKPISTRTLPAALAALVAKMKNGPSDETPEHPDR